jgi:hypothetical protein
MGLYLRAASMPPHAGQECWIKCQLDLAAKSVQEEQIEVRNRKPIPLITIKLMD